MKICQIKECENPVLAVGLCNKHWRRNKLFGSPCVTKWTPALLSGMPIAERMRRQTKRMESGCLEWTGGVDLDGYGRVSGVIDGIAYQRAHRIAWVLFHGKPIPKGMVVCHSCDNPRCVDPKHLWIGSVSENHQDMINKKRHWVVKGSQHPDAKLTEDQVRAILADARPHAAISQEYGVTASTVSSIKTRKSWAHLDVEYVAKARRVSPRKGKSDRINDEIVREIRNNTTSGVELAERYKVSRQLITNIRKRRSWAHVQ